MALAVAALPAMAETWRFALIGDTPYSAHERAELPKLLDTVADQGVELVAHIGDFKDGRSRCDDATFEDRRQVFAASRVPFVFVPGDNEWTDCARLSNGSYDPLERLATLRAVFWPDEHSLGQRRIVLERQPGTYPEHSRFRLGPVLFVTLNLPGGNNNRGPGETPGSEYAVRNPALLAWLKDSFALARREKLPGIVILFQADPGFSALAQGFPASGYRDFLHTLRDETLAFSGRVVAVHGDTHVNRIDQPLRDARGHIVENFVRVETFGYPLMGWTSGIIDPASPALFRFETHPWPPRP